MMLPCRCERPPRSWHIVAGILWLVPVAGAGGSQAAFSTPKEAGIRRRYVVLRRRTVSRYAPLVSPEHLGHI